MLRGPLDGRVLPLEDSMARSIKPAPAKSLPAAQSVGQTLTIVDGVVVGAPIVRRTGGGDVVEIDVSTTMFGAQRRVACGVVMSIEDIATTPVQDGDRVLVLGSTRRRFFRAGGQTVARTEIEGTAIVVGDDRRRRRKLFDQAAAWCSTAR
jgi:hypothetical protein